MRGGVAPGRVPGPPPAPWARLPPSIPRSAAVVVPRRRPHLESQPPAARSLAGPRARAAMELEVPEEAESAEGGTVTSEATWSAESGAVAGNGSGPRVPICTRVDPPAGSAGAQWTRPSAGGAPRPAAGRPERSTPGCGGAWNAPRLGRGTCPGPEGGGTPAWGLGVASPIPGIPGVGVGGRGLGAALGAGPHSERPWVEHPAWKRAGDRSSHPLPPPPALGRAAGECSASCRGRSGTAAFLSCWKGAALRVWSDEAPPFPGRGPCLQGGAGPGVTLCQMCPPAWTHLRRCQLPDLAPSPRRPSADGQILLVGKAWGSWGGGGRSLWPSGSASPPSPLFL